MKLVKLGGSVITVKDKYRTPRESTIRRLCSEIARSKEEVLIVCGAGSFGHIKASEFKLHKGHDDSIPGQAGAVALVQRDVRELNMLVLNALMEEGLNPVSIPPASVVINGNGKIYQMRTEVFTWFSELGVVPVTFGDVVLDSDIGFSICSGDWLMYRLAGDLKIKDAIFATNTDGVYTADPNENPDADLLREITTSQDGQIDLKGQTKPDVTGGMGSKVKVGLEMAALGVKTHILNGNENDRLFNALTGHDVVSTVIRGD